MPQYDFYEQLKDGKEGEAVVVKWLRDSGFWVLPTTKREEPSFNFDYYIMKDRSERQTLEVKTDRKAVNTGNLTIEVISQDTQEKPGWFTTCQAHKLAWLVDMNVYYELLWLDFSTLRYAFFINEWYKKRLVTIDNKQGWKTYCFLVPITDIRAISKSYTIQKHGGNENDNR